MSERSLRRRRHNPYTSTASNALYVGYVEDDESIEAIMKKFEELDRIREEMGITKHTESNSEFDSPVKQSNLQETEGLTQEQLEEVFKRTSSFTVKSATFAPNLDEVDDLDFWRIEMEDGNTAEYEEEDEYMTVDNDFWDEEFGERKRRKSDKSGSSRRSGLDRETLLQRYKIMQVRLQDRNGNFFTVKKKVSNIDPGLPTYMRIPPLPIPRSWALTISPPSVELVTPVIGSRYFEKDILSMDFTKLGTEFQAIYIDPPLLLPGEAPSPGKISVQQFGNLNLSVIVPKGFLFIWVEKEFIPDIVQIAEKWRFRYVENFCWIKKNINNQISRKPYRYFNKSKLSLLIFRKDGDIELRHQRNPDCVFDFIKPRAPDMLTEAKPRVMYEIIETLLPQAVFSEQNNKGDKLLELWAKKGARRQGWTTVVQPV